MTGSLNELGRARGFYLATACSAILWLAWRTDLNAQTAANSASDHPIQIASWQAAAGGHLEFEVASVKPSEPGNSLALT